MFQQNHHSQPFSTTWNISCTICMNLSCIQVTMSFFYYSFLWCFFKSGKAEINQIQKYSNFLHTYCNAEYARYITDWLSVESTACLFNDTIFKWCSKKHTKTLWWSSKAETWEMYTGSLYQNWIRFCIYPFVI